MPGTKRLIHDGRVVVLISPGYGSGWSTWGGDAAEDMLFDPQIGDIMLDQGLPREERLRRARVIAELKYPKQHLGGLDQLEAVELPMGTRFVVREHDGNEDVVLERDVQWYTA